MVEFIVCTVIGYNLYKNTASVVHISRPSLFSPAICLTSWIVWPIRWVPFCYHYRLKHTHMVLGHFCTCPSHSSLISRSHKWQCGADHFLLPGTLSHWYSLRNFLGGALFGCVIILILPCFVRCITLWGVFFLWSFTYHRGFIIWGSDVVTDGTIIPACWSQVSYVAWYFINRDRVLAVDFRYCALAKLHCASSVWILHPDSISYGLKTALSVPFCYHSIVSSLNVYPAEAHTRGSRALPCMPVTEECCRLYDYLISD